MGLLAAAAFGAAVSRVGGVLGFKLFHGSTAPILTIWQHWFASDALGMVTVAPLLIGVAAAARDQPPRSEVIESRGRFLPGLFSLEFSSENKLVK